MIIDIPQLAQFIRRTPKFKAYDEALVEFGLYASIKLPQISDEWLSLAIPFKLPEWELSSLAQISNSFSFHQAFVPPVERLYIQSRGSWWPDDIENIQWLELLRPFTSAKDLYISLEFSPRIAPALQELVEEGVTEVLPALQTLLLEETPLSEPVQENIGQFVSARQLSGHPIAVSRWERKHSDLGLDKGLDS